MHTWKGQLEIFHSSSSVEGQRPRCKKLLELTSVQMGRATKSAQIGSKYRTIDSRPWRAQIEQFLFRRLFIISNGRQHANVMGCHHTDPSTFFPSADRTLWCPTSSILLPWVHKHQAQSTSHQTVSLEAADLDLSKVKSYSGLIRLAQMPNDGRGPSTHADAIARFEGCSISARRLVSCASPGI